MGEEFNTEQREEYTHTLVDLVSRSDEYFIIIGWREANDETPIFYDFEGFPKEDILGLIQDTIFKVGE